MISEDYFSTYDEMINNGGAKARHVPNGLIKYPEVIIKDFKLPKSMERDQYSRKSIERYKDIGAYVKDSCSMVIFHSG